MATCPLLESKIHLIIAEPADLSYGLLMTTLSRWKLIREHKTEFECEAVDYLNERKFLRILRNPPEV